MRSTSGNTINCANPANRQHALNIGCPGWWFAPPGLSGGAQLPDLMGKSPGILAGGVSWSSENHGVAASYDGSTGYVDIGAPAQLELYTNLSLFAWILPTTFSSGQQFVLAKDFSTGARGFGIGVSTTGQLYVEVNGSSIAQSSGPSMYGKNSWFMIGATYNGSFWYCYVNEYIVANANLAPQAANAAARWNIGRRSYVGFNNNFHGLIDDVRVYNRALAQSEIRDLFNSGLAGHPTTLNRLYSRYTAPARLLSGGAALLMAM